MTIPLADAIINVIDVGTGDPVLVFLHYWGGSARTWTQVTEKLQASYRCIAYDQRGWGSSRGNKDSYNLKQLADDATALITALHLKEYVLIGHSMGGKAAQLLASRQPAGLKALILVAPASPIPQHIPEEAKQAQLHAYDNRESALKAAKFLTFMQHSEAALEQVIEDSLAGSPEAKLAWPTVIAYEDVSANVSQISVPTLILVGDHDLQDPEKQQRTEVLPLIPGAELKVIQNCGHLMPIDQPVALATAIETYLRKLI